MKNKENLGYSINLILGDWSDNGHGKTDRIQILSNLDAGSIEEAYKKGTKKLKFDFSEEVASVYEDNQISYKNWEKLTKLGLKLEDIFPDGYEYGCELKEAQEAVLNKEDFSLYQEPFAKIYLFIVKLGAPEFEYEIVEDNNSVINIGGYRLFF